MEVVKYFGLLDSKMTWKQHIVKKRKHNDLKAREINCNCTNMDLRNQVVGMSQQIS